MPVHYEPGDSPETVEASVLLRVLSERRPTLFNLMPAKMELDLQTNDLLRHVKVDVSEAWVEWRLTARTYFGKAVLERYAALRALIWGSGGL